MYLFDFHLFLWFGTENIYFLMRKFFLFFYFNFLPVSNSFLLISIILCNLMCLIYDELNFIVCKWLLFFIQQIHQLFNGFAFGQVKAFHDFKSIDFHFSEVFLLQKNFKSLCEVFQVKLFDVRYWKNMLQISVVDSGWRYGNFSLDVSLSVCFADPQMVVFIAIRRNKRIH